MELLAALLGIVAGAIGPAVVFLIGWLYYRGEELS